MLPDKNQCTGCEACAQVCPKHCISMVSDYEGFLYPYIDTTSCIECHRCERVCPTLVKTNEREPLAVYGYQNKQEEIRLRSSSGGFFSALAEQVLPEGGIVFGAAFNDEWAVTHQYCEKMDDLIRFRGSKYVQSRMDNIFCKVKEMLQTGRKVLFTGTPCQVRGLLLFLRKPYDNLFTLDFVCHGVPSPGVWQRYFNEVTGSSYKKVCEVNFREKRFFFGWKVFGFDILTNTGKCVWKTRGRENPYMMGFLENVYLRPSCYECPVKSLKSGSDITMGDFWGISQIAPSLSDNRGTSLVLINTDKGKVLFKAIASDECEVQEFDYDTACLSNSSLRHSVKPHPNRSLFFCNFSAYKQITPLILDTCRPGLIKQMKWKVKVILSKFRIYV